MEVLLSTQELFSRIQTGISRQLSDMREVDDDELYGLIDEQIEKAEEDNYLPVARKLMLRTRLFDSFRRLDILQELIDRKDITEIMVNGPEHVFVEQAGQVIEWPLKFKSQEQLEDLIQQIVSRVNRVVNVSQPIVDARLPDGSRVHVVLPPVSLSGPVLTIRKFPEPISMEKLIGYGAITREAAEFLGRLVRAGYNIFISGGTNSGKTTFLNALSAFIPATERVITIEDSAELQLMHIENLISMEARRANPQGEGAVTIADLIKASLRMNPDRIVVGEVRGAEALDMLQAMNTGHDGSLSTGHANSAREMLTRIETMVLSSGAGAGMPLDAIRAQMASAIDIIVHLGRVRDRSRKVLAIVEVTGFEEGQIRTNTLYEFREDFGKSGKSKGKVTGMLKKTASLQNTGKLAASGDGLFGI
ncbi:MAG: CpaF family protein [Lachnospiraceae bacterium]|nr:CpaF family protein [Lachnospiraceae bacterium]